LIDRLLKCRFFDNFKDLQRSPAGWPPFWTSNRRRSREGSCISGSGLLFDAAGSVTAAELDDVMPYLNGDLCETEEAMKMMKLADLLEQYYEARVISMCANCEYVAQVLMRFITATIAYGHNLNTLCRTPNVEQISSMISSFIPSANLILFRYFACHHEPEPEPELTGESIQVMAIYKHVKSALNSQFLH
jgi:hypothetical protein